MSVNDNDKININKREEIINEYIENNNGCCIDNDYKYNLIKRTRECRNVHDMLKQYNEKKEYNVSEQFLIVSLESLFIIMLNCGHLSSSLLSLLFDMKVKIDKINKIYTKEFINNIIGFIDEITCMCDKGEMNNIEDICNDLINTFMYIE